jgi:hypothetical protein
MKYRRLQTAGHVVDVGTENGFRNFVEELPVEWPLATKQSPDNTLKTGTTSPFQFYTYSTFMVNFPS